MMITVCVPQGGGPRQRNHPVEVSLLVLRDLGLELGAVHGDIWPGCTRFSAGGNLADVAGQLVSAWVSYYTRHATDSAACGLLER